jgi:Calpain family cysteine protease
MAKKKTTKTKKQKKKQTKTESTTKAKPEDVDVEQHPGDAVANGGVNNKDKDQKKLKKETQRAKKKRLQQNKPKQAVARRQGGVNNLYTPTGCGLCIFKFRMQFRIFKLENKRKQRMQQFGIDYTNMVMESTVPVFKRRCLREAMEDLDDINEQIDMCYDAIDHKVEELESGHQFNNKRTPNDKSKPKNKIQRNRENKLPKRDSSRHLMGNHQRRNDAMRPMSVVDLDKLPQEFQGPDVDKWTHCEWNLVEHKTNGGWSKKTEGEVDQIRGKSIERAVAKFKAHPKLFIAMFYPTEMLQWPVEEQQYTMIYRDGTTGLKPKGISKKGKVTFLMHQYQPIPSFSKQDNRQLPKTFRDQYTDGMKYRGKKLVTKSNPPLLPGRGMGLIDDPTLKIIGMVNPSDIAQGQCGNCWLLSGIASLADFDGAIRRLFRKTKNLDQMPFADGRPNSYTVSLYDLRTWKEVDIVVDERLPVRTDGSGRLFGAKPSKDGELWVCYLEKAMAAHCGGWDNIEGGQCTHAWALLTGNKRQYIIQRSMADPDLFCCTARYDPENQQWAEHDNSPSGGKAGIWEVPWPELGGGGDELLDEDELFARMCTWSDSNFLVAASTKGASDENTTNGVVDNHAYSVVEVLDDVAGSGIDLILVRNPWGR